MATKLALKPKMLSDYGATQPRSPADRTCSSSTKDRILIADVKGHRRYNLPPCTAEQHAAASRHNIVRYNVAAIRRQQREIHVIHRLRNRSPRFRLHH